MTRKTLKLDAPWTYRTPATTIDYPAGTHSVDQAIHDAAEAAGVIGSMAKEDTSDGSGIAEEGQARDPAAAEG
jgi:hypothetical protein